MMNVLFAVMLCAFIAQPMAAHAAMKLTAVSVETKIEEVESVVAKSLYFASLPKGWKRQGIKQLGMELYNNGRSDSEKIAILVTLIDEKGLTPAKMAERVRSEAGKSYKILSGPSTSGKYTTLRVKLLNRPEMTPSVAQYYFLDQPGGGLVQVSVSSFNPEAIDAERAKIDSFLESQISG